LLTRDLLYDMSFGLADHSRRHRSSTGGMELSYATSHVMSADGWFFDFCLRSAGATNPVSNIVRPLHRLHAASSLRLFGNGGHE
jgi:hypothetical protein